METLSINKSKALKKVQYYPTVDKKDSIFIHHTAGTSAQGALSWWDQTPDVVGTAYVIERDGTIYEAFDPSFYAYHLGIKDDDNYMEKHSIGIEIVSAGQLYKEADGKYYFYPLYPSKNGAKVIPESEVWAVDWRGYKHYHAYTDKQIESTINLIKHLCQKFGIKIQSNLEKFWEYNPEIYKKHITGLWSHSSVRSDKNDIIPHLPFIQKLISSLGQPQSKPLSNVGGVSQNSVLPKKK